MDDERRIGRVMMRMVQCTDALGRDEIAHDMRTDPETGAALHRLRVNGVEGPWVTKYALAHNGIYSATHNYYADEMPRVFFAIAIHEHIGSRRAIPEIDNKLRQPSQRAFPRSAGDTAVSNPDPGNEEGIETPPPSELEPPLSAADGGEVPRLCAGTRDTRPCRACGGTGEIR